MSDRAKPLTAPALDAQAVENKMRRALGLQGNTRPVLQQRPDQARARHKFVQDGGVPVVMVSRSEDASAPFKARIAELESMLTAERTAHGVAKRALSDANATNQSLQTRLTHADLAHKDAVAAERQTRNAMGALQQEVADLQAQVAAAGLKIRALSRKDAEEPEPQPVKWWLASSRTTKS